jgi:uncharacterized membrane protein YoaK (UPF0700 family)
MPLGLPRVVMIFAAIALLALAFYQNNNYLILVIGALILSMLCVCLHSPLLTKSPKY